MCSWIRPSLICFALVLLASSSAVAGDRTLSVSQLEELRTAGSNWIEPGPDSSLKPFLEYPGPTVKLRVCLTRTGKLRSVKLVASSGDAAYDKTVLATARKTWRFRAYRGKKKKKVAVCAPTFATYDFAVVGSSDEPGEGIDSGMSKRDPTVENTTPTALEALRISGDKNIVPDDATKEEISKAGKTRLVIPFKVCLDDTGKVKSVAILKSSGFPAYDAKIEAGVKTWVYRPFQVNGVATPVCSAVTLIYVQKS